MKAKGFIRRKRSGNLIRVFFLLSTLALFVFILRLMDLLKIKCAENFVKKGTSAPSMPDDFCTFKPLSPADAEEERLLLDSIAWPKTPLLPTPLSLNQTSDPSHSTFTMLPRKGGGEWHVGDQLEVMIQMYDFRGKAKEYGGDFLIAWLHNRTLEAGVAGRVLDHLNGSYSAVFSLLWEGRAQVEVTLVHPSMAVTVLRRLNREHPDRIIFNSVFRSGSISENTNCNVCLRQTNQTQCNFTDLRTGDPWFCYKPKNLSCDARVSHTKTGYMNVLTAKEKKLFQRNINMKVSIKAAGPASVTVLPQRKGQPRTDQGSEKSGLSGYYYQGVWRSLGDTKVRQFKNASAISECLKGKMVHLYGDSTIRQWYEFLDDALPDAKTVDLNSPKQAGPFMIWDSAKDILVTYRIHGLPLRITIMPTSKESYIANELDALVGGPNTVVVIGIFAHFSTFPIEIYIRRLQSIRRAVVRLLNRAPGTLVVIKTGTLQDVHIASVASNSDWFSIQLNKVLRAMFKGLHVQLVDAWDMVQAYHLPHDIHPRHPIIKNMIDVLLSYVCPQKKKKTS
ncbi:NXPE family member 3-like isoform X2 [Cheilinus undulatus]|uniref:NXPE family member 3-like isoform X2 n=1 Tax=Cheilinus undulatus TaxID=241271 RepID=UPI001BD5CB41|nr:NXPE family member 3-like isoform X2 [Cheilinus undulatus]